MLLRLTVALLAILAALYFAAPEAPAPSRADLAALRAERQRTVQLTLPDRPAPLVPEAASTPAEDAPRPEPVPEVESAPEQPAPAERVAEPVAEASQPPAPEAARPAEPSVQPEPEPAPEPAAEPEAAPQPEPQPQLLYVTGSRVNLRAGPSTDNAVRGQVVQGQAVELVERLDNGWVEIRADGVDGTVFMSGDFLSETP